MAVKAVLELEGKKFNIHEFNYKLKQPANKMGFPAGDPFGGYITLTLESDKETTIYDWTKSHDMQKNGIITFYKQDGMSQFKQLKFYEAYCFVIHEEFTSRGEFAMRYTIEISPGNVNYNGSNYTKIWSKPQIDLKNASTFVEEEEKEIKYVNGHFYNKDGTFEGKVNEASNTGNVTDVYTCTGKGKATDSKGVEIDVYNGIKILKEDGENVKHDVFANNSYLVYHEASTAGNSETALWIAHTVNNALNSKYRRGKSTFNELIKTGYSSASESDKSQKIETSADGDNEKFARKAIIDVLSQGIDPTDSAYFWDGLDIFTKTNELDHPKFKQYISVTILSTHLKSATDFWAIDTNKAKVNSQAVINDIFLDEYELKNVTDGSIINNSGAFSGARNNSSNNSEVTERLKSTGFKSGTIFWTTSND